MARKLPACCRGSPSVSFRVQTRSEPQLPRNTTQEPQSHCPKLVNNIRFVTSLSQFDTFEFPLALFKVSVARLQETIPRTFTRHEVQPIPSVSEHCTTYCVTLECTWVNNSNVAPAWSQTRGVTGCVGLSVSRAVHGVLDCITQEESPLTARSLSRHTFQFPLVYPEPECAVPAFAVCVRPLIPRTRSTTSSSAQNYIHTRSAGSQHEV